MPALAIVLATACWASTMIANKLAVDVLAVTEITSMRFLIGAVMMRQLRGLRHIGLGPIVMGLLEPGMASLFLVWGSPIRAWSARASSSAPCRSSCPYSVGPYCGSLFGPAFSSGPPSPSQEPFFWFKGKAIMAAARSRATCCVSLPFCSSVPTS